MASRDRFRHGVLAGRLALAARDVGRYGAFLAMRRVRFTPQGRRREWVHDARDEWIGFGKENEQRGDVVGHRLGPSFGKEQRAEIVPDLIDHTDAEPS